jgi:hypothetical protein
MFKEEDGRRKTDDGTRVSILVFLEVVFKGGVKFADVESPNRRPKQWYSKVFFSQLEKLKDLLAEKKRA